MLRKLLLGLLLLCLALIAVVILLKPPSVPAAAIVSAVQRDPRLLARAWSLPVAARYRKGLVFQSNGSVCGPASLANVFRSLDEPSATESSVLAGSGFCTIGFCFMGLTLDQLAEVARRRSRRSVTVLRNLTPEAFREQLLRSNDLHARYVVNFSRKPIFAGGGGHHSPLAGYLEAEDLVFVLDVNRDFQPWLIPRARLFAALDTLDGEQKRGLLRIE